MTDDEHCQRTARAMLTYLAEPADRLLGALLAANEPAVVVAAIRAGRLPRTAQRPERQAGTITRALQRWAARVPYAPADLDLGAWQRNGIRLICPGDPEWPTQLQDLGDKAPYALWLRGSADLR